MADSPEQTASATNEAENTGPADLGDSNKSSVYYPVDQLRTDNSTEAIAESSDASTGVTDNTNLVLRCQFCKRHVQCINDKITTLAVFGDSSQPDNPRHSIQALNCSRCNHKTIGVKLCQRWWQLDEALKSANTRRDGYHQVTMYGERVLLFLLNSVIYTQQDFEEGRDIPISAHHPCEQAKLLWRNNTAIGFYSYKQQGAPLNDHVGLLCTWSIPVLDGLYVRKEHRGHELGLQGLKDFLAMYPEGPIGIAQPCSKTFVKVCHKYLKKHPEDRSRLYLCTPPGSEDNRTSLWRHSKKIVKQYERNSTTSSLSSSSSSSSATQMASVTSPNTSTYPTTSLLETLATVSESLRLAEGAEASAVGIDSRVGDGSVMVKGRADGGSNSKKSGSQDDVGEGSVIVSSASSGLNNCREEHKCGLPCSSCIKSSNQVCSNGKHNECQTNERSQNSSLLGRKEDLCHADSSEAIANISMESGRDEKAYDKEGAQRDTEPQNIASSSSVLYETDDAHQPSHETHMSPSHEAETTAIDLSAKRSSHIENHRKSDIATNSTAVMGDALKRVDSSICADDDRSVGGGVEENHDGDDCSVQRGVVSEGIEPSKECDNDVLKNLLRKPKVIPKKDREQPPVHTSGSIVKIETKQDNIAFPSHGNHSSMLNRPTASDASETKPAIKVKPERLQEALPIRVEAVGKQETVDEGLDEPMRMQQVLGDIVESVVRNGNDDHLHQQQNSPREDPSGLGFLDGHIRQLLQKDDEPCTTTPSPQPVRPSRPHPTRVIHNPLVGTGDDSRDNIDSLSKESPAILPNLLTGFPRQEDNAEASASASDLPQSGVTGDNAQLMGSDGQSPSPNADSVTGRRRPFRVRDYSLWFTSENYNIMAQKRSAPHGGRVQDTAAVPPQTWKRNRRSDTSAGSSADRLRPPTWSIWPSVQSGERLRDALTSSNPVIPNDANSSGGGRAGVTVRELLQRHIDVPPEPSSTLPSVIPPSVVNTSSYTPTSTTYVYSNSLNSQQHTRAHSLSSQQQQPVADPHLAPSQRFLNPPVTSYNSYVAQQEKQTGDPPVGHFHTFRWTRPRRVYARRGTRHPAAAARASTPDSSFDEVRPVAPFTRISTDDQNCGVETLGQPPPAPQETQDNFAPVRSHFSQSSLDSQEVVAGSNMTVTDSTQTMDISAPQASSSPNASTSSGGDARQSTSTETASSSLIKQLLLREPGIHATKSETASQRQSCLHESRVSQSHPTSEDEQQGHSSAMFRDGEGEISSQQRGDQDEEEDEEEESDNKAALRLQLGINVGVNVGAVVNGRNTQTSNYTCEHCDIVFTDSVMYVLHMGCHGRRSAFECNRCGLVCRDKYEFAIHFIQGEHNID